MMDVKMFAAERPSGMVSHISSKTLKRFFEMSPIPLVLASPVFDDCPLIMVNDAFLDLTGYARDDVIGQNCRFLQGPGTEPEARAAIGQALATNSETVVSITNYRKNGSSFKNCLFLFPIFDADGRLLYTMGSQCEMPSAASGSLLSSHARFLDQTLELNNPLLVHREKIQIGATVSCVQAIQDYFGGGGFGGGGRERQADRQKEVA